MALARLALKNLQQKTASTTTKNSILPTSNYYNFTNNYIGEKLLGVVQGQYGVQQRLCLSTSSETSDGGKEVAVESDEGGRRRSNMMKSKWKSLLPRTLRRPTSLWRRKDHNNTRDITHPFGNEIFPGSSVGNALLETAENMNRLFENVIPTQITAPSPAQLMGKFKETDENYKLRYDMPGLTKDDLKVTVDNGVLRIRGERKVEEEDESDDEYFMSYGYYNTSLVLPDDAKQDDIKAELKDGVLNITIPKTESHGRDVKEVKVY